MKHFDYFAPTEIIFGAGRVTEAGALAARYGKKAMLVTVPEFPAVAELYAKVKKSLSDAGVACVHYDGVIPNPTTELVTRGAELAKAEGSEVLPICAKLEQDIAELDDPEERAMFLEDLGIEKSGLDRLIQCSYELLGLISFLTYGKDECRAWTIRKGTKAPQAAGKIHSDIERGFIRAETINFDEMMACGGSVAAAKEKGLLRSEGKDYVVKDGDMIYFRFNV